MTFDVDRLRGRGGRRPRSAARRRDRGRCRAGRRDPRLPPRRCDDRRSQRASRAPSRGARSWSASRALISGPGPIGRAGTRTVYGFHLGRDWATSRPSTPDPYKPRRVVCPADSEIDERKETILSLLELPDAPPFNWESVGVGARRLGRGAPPGQRAPRQRAPGVPLPAPRVRPERARRAARALRRMGVHARRLGAAHAGRAHPRAGDSAPPRCCPTASATAHACASSCSTRRSQPSSSRSCCRGPARVSAPPGDGERAVVAGSSLGGLRRCRWRTPAGQSSATSSRCRAPSAARGSRPDQPPGEGDGHRPRVFLAAGALETSVWPGRRAPALLHANQHLRDVLVAGGSDVGYVEFPGGHDYIWWRRCSPRGSRGCSFRACSTCS